MELTQARKLQSLKEIQRFLDDHASALGGLASTGMRRRLDQSIISLARMATAQTSNALASQSATQKVRLLTGELLTYHMAPISRIAGIALPHLPELGPLGMPPARETGERLVAVARGMAAEAAKYQTTLVQAGLPDDFIGRLTEATEALAVAIADRKQRQAHRGAATRLLARGLVEARKVVNVLDAFVKAAARGDDTMLATWKIVKRQRKANSARLDLAPEGDPPFDAVGGAE